MSPEEARKQIEAILNDPNASTEQKREAALENLSNEQIVVTYESRKTKMHANARNINVNGVTVTFHGKPLIEETQLVINYGNRYGFIGPNGSGKVRRLAFCRSIPFQHETKRSFWKKMPSWAFQSDRIAHFQKIIPQPHSFFFLLFVSHSLLSCCHVCSRVPS